jgi:predicted O-linked N-acetylglucosamine transferase (SPINDLY family)
MASIYRQTSQPHGLGEPVEDLDAACSGAINLQLAGRLDEAERSYQTILRSAPRHAAANYGLGMLYLQQRRPAEGLSLLHNALQASPQTSEFWLGYLEGLLLNGRSDGACAALERARNQGLGGAAVEDFARRLDAAMGGEAERELLEALKRGDTAMALSLAHSSIRRFPERGVPWKVFGALLWAEGRPAEALAAMRHSARLLPQDAEAHCNLGLTLTKLEHVEEGEASLRQALVIDPHFSIAHYRLGMTLSLQGRLDEAEASLRRGLDLRAHYTAHDDAQNHSNLLFILAHDPAIGAAELFAEHCRYAEHVEGPLRASPARAHRPPYANDRDAARPLKVGFVSGDLYDHSVGQFLAPIVEQLARRPSVELQAYCTHPQSDAQSRRLQAHLTGFTAVDALSDDEVAARITADRIDILIDLSGHTAHNRLPVFARKPAPVQVSWLGYPGTTGLKAMDYYLADPQWLPPGEFDRMFTEQLVYLPDRWAFRPHADVPTVDPLPALATGRLTFGSFHRRSKINSVTLRLWAEVLLALPGAALLMAGVAPGAEEASVRQYFAANGIDPARLTYHARGSMPTYLALHNKVDIALDTLPFSGATTTMHSLSMGVPTLTLAGATPQSRACAGILAKLGLDAFIAGDAADFVAKALHWDRHRGDLALLRAALPTRLAEAPAGRPDLFATHFEQALRHMWRRWCAGLPAASFAIGDGGPVTS